jgi:tRNA(Ile)-lysidine synthetase-like protein
VSAAKTAVGARPVSAAEATALFADLVSAPAIVLAISGGPDSTALLLLAARWRAGRKRGPKLLAVTIDHGLRAESAHEAKQVARLARKLGVAHRTLRWTGKKPATGIQEKARQARYGLLADAAAKAGASHVLTAHTLDDQAETVLMRFLRGSGLSGLSGMARVSPLSVLRPAPSPPELGLARVPHHRAQVGQARLAVGEGWGGGYDEKRARKKSPLSRSARSQVYAGCVNLPAMRTDLPHKGGGNNQRSAGSSSDQLLLLRPFLGLSKTRLIATVTAAKIPFASDPSNADPRFTRIRMRNLMPALAAEGLSTERLALLARRMRRADAALELAAEVAGEMLSSAPWSDAGPISLDAAGFGFLPSEIALRLLGRAVTSRGDEGPVELAKLELLHAALTSQKPGTARFRRTLAGAVVTLTPDRRLIVETAPQRRLRTGNTALTTGRGGRNKAHKPR